MERTWNISGLGQSVRGRADGDQRWADELNCYFNRFSSPPTPSAPLSVPPSSHVSSPTDTPPFPQRPSSTASPSTPMPPAHSIRTVYSTSSPLPPTPNSLPPAVPSSLPPLPHIRPGLERAEATEPEECCRTRQHQSQAAEELCRPAL
ncbi:hypothetical protein XENORESO_004423 [Xenotaenia resolanae]|uniref:Uncharacterized protein n=1 Tax=Xenotaenia resolanae TaxID=208358 RepID=A0ABV0W768_9TELE